MILDDEIEADIRLEFDSLLTVLLRRLYELATLNFTRQETD